MKPVVYDHRLNEAILEKNEPRGQHHMKPSVRQLLCVASLCLLPYAANAQLLGPFTVRVGAGIEHDSNVLRAPRDEERSDTAVYGLVGIKGDKRYGLQRFRVDAEATHYKYQDLSALNYSTVNYLAAWDWQVTPRLGGVLSAERRQYRDLTRFTNVGGSGVPGTGQRTDRNELFEAKYMVDGPWRVLGGLQHTSSRSRESRPELGLWDASPSVRSVRAGVAYEYASGTEIAARLRRGDGEYRDLPASLGSADFRENEAELTMKWLVTGKTGIDARVAYLERTHSAAPQLDFDGPVGHATISWEATAKTRVAVGVATDLYSYQLDGAGHVRSNRMFVRPTWKPTVQTEVSLTYIREHRNWRGVALSSVDNGRRDTSNAAVAAVGWEPRRNLNLTGTVRFEDRDSNVSGNRYRVTTVGAAAVYAF